MKKSALSRSTAAKRTVMLGCAPYAIPANKSITLTVKVGKRYRSLLRKGKVKRATLTAGGKSTSVKVKTKKK